MTHPYGTAFAAYLLLAVGYTFPLILRLSEVVPHDLGDPLLSTAILWWNAHVLPFTERWWNGMALYPASGFLASSDPRLGESLLASPLQWLGLGPVAAYNLTLLMTFPLSAIAAHWLGYVLTRRHDAAALAGLVYGFCPFRAAHLSHLELLAGFGMPIALAALHLFRETGGRRWLIVLSGALVVQGYCSSYYLLFFAVMVAVWLPWFLRPAELRLLPGLAAAAVAALLALTPLIAGYLRIHAHYGLTRTFTEIQAFSAQGTSLFAADPGLLVWGWTSRFGQREGLLFPGLTISLLVLAYGVGAWRRARLHDGLDRVAAGFLAAAILCAAIAGAGWAFGPWRIDVPGLTMSSGSSYKALTLGLLMCCLWLGTSSSLRQAWQRRSAFAFYALAAALLFLCSFGPEPTFRGHQFLYKPPYAWLMNLPVFASIRVPARFGMVAMLALAAAGAVAFDGWRLSPRSRRLAAGLLLLGVLADGWVRPISMQPLPTQWSAGRTDGFAAVMELPLGDLMGDMAATYRAMGHGRPVVNGASGFEPRHYVALKTASEELDPTILDWLPPRGRVLIALDRQRATAADWERVLAAHPRVTPLAPEGQWLFYALAPPIPAPACEETLSPVVSIAFNGSPIDPAPLADGNPHTWWTTTNAALAGESLVLDLGRSRAPCALAVSVGELVRSYPRRLTVDSSEDGTRWQPVASARTAGLTIRAALDDPARVAFAIPLTPSVARYLRVTLGDGHATAPWGMTELGVRVRAPAR